jgi:hypothetical protein
MVRPLSGWPQGYSCFPPLCRTPLVCRSRIRVSVWFALSCAVLSAVFRLAAIPVLLPAPFPWGGVSFLRQRHSLARRPERHPWPRTPVACRLLRCWLAWPLLPVQSRLYIRSAQFLYPFLSRSCSIAIQPWQKARLYRPLQSTTAKQSAVRLSVSSYLYTGNARGGA